MLKAFKHDGACAVDRACIIHIGGVAARLLDDGRAEIDNAALIALDIGVIGRAVVNHRHKPVARVARRDIDDRAARNLEDARAIGADIHRAAGCAARIG